MVTAHSVEPVVLPSATIVKTWFVRYADNQLFTTRYKLIGTSDCFEKFISRLLYLTITLQAFLAHSPQYILLLTRRYWNDRSQGGL